MNALEHNMGTTPTPGHAPDVNKKANLVIWAYFVGFGLALYVLISLVTVYFRIETDKEAFVKVGSVESKELIEYKKDQAAILAGQKGVVQGKKNISIDAAMAKVLEVTK